MTALSAPLRRMDALAHELIARAAPIRFAVADTAAARDAVLRLRYRVVIERGWTGPDDLTDETERDGYDDRARFVVGWDEEELVAAARLVFPSEEARLPTEDAFDLTVEPSGRVANVDRMIVARSHSDAGHRVFAGLAGRCWLELRTAGYHVWAGIDSLPMIRLYRRMGVHVTVLGDARRYWGEDRYPVRFDVLEGASHLIERWQ